MEALVTNTVDQHCYSQKGRKSLKREWFQQFPSLLGYVLGGAHEIWEITIQEQGYFPRRSQDLQFREGSVHTLPSNSTSGPWPLTHSAPAAVPG